MSAQRLHYAWVVAGLTFLALVVAAGVRSTPGVLMVPLEQDLGWDRVTLSGAVSLNLVLYGLMGPFSAALIERLGLRLVVTLSLLLLSAGMALTSLMRESWQLILLWGVVVGAGSGLVAMSLAAIVATRWFEHRRGLVTGLLAASAATGQLVFLPLLAWVVQEWGWRCAVLGIAATAVTVAPLVALLMRNRPADLGLLPYGATTAPPLPTPAGNPFRTALVALFEGLQRRDFWLLAGTFFVCGASTNGLIGTHLVPACIDYGIPEVQAAGLLAAMGIFDLVGTTLSGWLTDRWDARWLLAWYYGLRGLSLLALPLAFDAQFYGLSLFAIFYGLDWIATVPPTVKLTASCFGPARAGIMFGWIFAAHQLGAAFIALLAGTIRVELGEYLAAFLFAGLLCLAAALGSLLIGRHPGAAARHPTIPPAVPPATPAGA